MFQMEYRKCITLVLVANTMPLCWNCLVQVSRICLICVTGSFLFELCSWLPFSWYVECITCVTCAHAESCFCYPDYDGVFYLQHDLRLQLFMGYASVDDMAWCIHDWESNCLSFWCLKTNRSVQSWVSIENQNRTFEYLFFFWPELVINNAFDNGQTRYWHFKTRSINKENG